MGHDGVRVRAARYRRRASRYKLQGFFNDEAPRVAGRSGTAGHGIAHSPPNTTPTVSGSRLRFSPEVKTLWNRPSAKSRVVPDPIGT